MVFFLCCMLSIGPRLYSCDSSGVFGDDFPTLERVIQLTECGISSQPSMVQLEILYNTHTLFYLSEGDMEVRVINTTNPYGMQYLYVHHYISHPCKYSTQRRDSISI